MRAVRSRWLFASLFVVDAVLTLSVTLVGQWATTGFDPIFYNPVLIAAAELAFMFLESYGPFLVVYKVGFELAVARFPKVHRTVVCWALFPALSAISVSVAVVSFGKNLDAIDVLIPLGLSTVNVSAFFLVRVRRAVSAP